MNDNLLVNVDSWDLTLFIHKEVIRIRCLVFSTNHKSLA